MALQKCSSVRVVVADRWLSGFNNLDSNKSKQYNRWSADFLSIQSVLELFFSLSHLPLKPEKLPHHYNLLVVEVHKKTAVKKQLHFIFQRYVPFLLKNKNSFIKNKEETIKL